MKQLQIVKSPPDALTLLLMEACGQGREVTRYDLYQDQDYARLVELIFSHEQVVSWW
ncbi:MAG: hypothetical protein HY910_07955 [Desulfarculus sp.]|nr:hypothetical protein [Desulfarculus sp.]